MNTYKYDFCVRCGNFGNTHMHSCPPQWLVIDADDWSGDVCCSDCVTFFADSGQEAAEIWREGLDECYEGEFDVYVKQLSSDSVWAKFSTWGEVKVIYRAREIESHG